VRKAWTKSQPAILSHQELQRGRGRQTLRTWQSRITEITGRPNCGLVFARNQAADIVR